MAKWINLPLAPLLHNPYQAAFWQAHRARLCRGCKIEFDCPPNFVCPQCHKKGTRAFNRLLLLAGRRGGKTLGAAIAVAEAATIPNSIIWACAPTAPKLHRYVLPALQQLIPASWVIPNGFSAEFLDLRLKNGTLIHLQTLEDPDQGRGQGADVIWIDESCELTLDHWEVIRPSLADREGAAIMSSSPRGFDWVYENFYRQAEEGVSGYWACRYTTSDNPTISKEEIADAKATMSDAMFRQEFLADFVVFQGAIYGGSIEPAVLHTDDAIRAVIPEWPQIHTGRQVLVGIDTGADHPFGAVKIVVTERGLVVVGEYLERNKSFIEHAASLKRLAFSHGIGPVRFAINKNERQPMIELAQHGIGCERAQNDVVSGTERVKSWLHTHQLFFIDSLVPQTIKQMKSYRWADNYSPKDEQKKVKEKVYKKEDELPDCIRYALQCYPVLPKATPLSPLRDLSKMPDEMRGAIERFRRIDNEPKLDPNDSMQDFWS